MWLSTRGRYGVRAMLELALNHDKGTLRLRDIAQGQEISPKYLGQFLGPLKLAGLVEVNVVMPSSPILTDFAVASRHLYLESAVQEMVKEDELSEDEASAWLGYLRQADKAGHFFCAMTGFIACGKKP